MDVDPKTGEVKPRGGGQVGNPKGDKPELGPDGKPLGLIKKGMRAVKGAIGGGLATATRNDPNAGILQKGAAVTGALAGRALGGAFKVAGQAIGGLGAGIRGDGGKKQPDGGTPPEGGTTQPQGGTQGGTTQTPTPPKGPQGGTTPPKGPQTPPVDKNKDGVDDKTGAEVDADGDGKNDVTKKPVKRQKTGGKVKGQVSDTDSAKYQRDRRAKLKQQQKDANKDGKDDATGQPIQQQPATGGKGAAQADAQADDIAARKDAVAQSKAQRGAITPQDHQLIRNDLAALAQTKDPKIARKIADKLSAYKDQGTDVSDYASSLNAVQKKVGIKGTAAKVARGMRSEAYQFMNSILESVNLTWQDIGYDVIILEEETEYVYLIPAGLQRIRELAGV